MMLIAPHNLRLFYLLRCVLLRNRSLEMAYVNPEFDPKDFHILDYILVPGSEAKAVLSCIRMSNVSVHQLQKRWSTGLGCAQGRFAASLFHPASQNIAQVAKISIMKKAGGQWEGALSIISSI